MSEDEEDIGKGMAPSGAAAAKDPKTRAEELNTETKEDRKKMAMTMKAEGYNRVEISHAFKEITGTGLGPTQWKEWKEEEKLREQAREAALVVLTAEEKQFATTVAAKLKTLNEKFQALIIDLGMYVFESVTPLVPADTTEEKIYKTKGWLQDAITAFNPEEMREIEKFGAAAFLAAQELKAQINELMAWADPSARLQNMAEKALYSPSPLNDKAFSILMLELVKSINAVPRFSRGSRVSELPGIVKAYAEARGVTPQKAEKVFSEVLQEVNASE